MPHSSLAVANEFLRRAKDADTELTQMQLQKLVYLAHGWSLAIKDEPIVQDEFEAWKFGPVIRRLYDALNFYGRRPISSFIIWGQDTPFKDDDGTEAFDEISENEARLIDKVWSVYGKYPAFKLSALTHEPGSPWEQCFVEGKNNVIPDKKIGEYFNSLRAKTAA